MPAPELHIVGGFLGSGKTTAIAAAAKQLMRSGMRVGVVTNDQGRHLVDTLFFEEATVPTVEVTGGCFCCNYDDFEKRLSALDASARPDVVFAESVGSCADVVATVVQPLLHLDRSAYTPNSFSVFGDSRLLHRHFAGGMLPFSDEIVYIFEKQLEEAGLIIVNKSDLLYGDDLDDLMNRLSEHYPGKPVVLQDTLAEGGVDQWIDRIRSGQLALPEPLAEMDYQTYGAGEAQLAWLDREVDLALHGRDGRDVVWAIVSGMESLIRARHWPVGHLKFVYDDGDQKGKISFTTESNGKNGVALPILMGSRVRLLINARVAAPVEELESLVDAVLFEVVERMGVTWFAGPTRSFHPPFPRPAYRMAR